MVQCTWKTRAWYLGFIYFWLLNYLDGMNPDNPLRLSSYPAMLQGDLTDDSFPMILDNPVRSSFVRGRQRWAQRENWLMMSFTVATFPASQVLRFRRYTHIFGKRRHQIWEDCHGNTRRVGKQQWSGMIYFSRWSEYICTQMNSVFGLVGTWQPLPPWPPCAPAPPSRQRRMPRRNAIWRRLARRSGLRAGRRAVRSWSSGGKKPAGRVLGAAASGSSSGIVAKSGVGWAWRRVSWVGTGNQSSLGETLPPLKSREDDDQETRIPSVEQR